MSARCSLRTDTHTLLTVGMPTTTLYWGHWVREFPQDHGPSIQGCCCSQWCSEPPHSIAPSTLRGHRLVSDCCLGIGIGNSEPIKDTSGCRKKDLALPVPSEGSRMYPMPWAAYSAPLSPAASPLTPTGSPEPTSDSRTRAQSRGQRDRSPEGTTHESRSPHGAHSPGVIPETGSSLQRAERDLQHGLAEMLRAAPGPCVAKLSPATNASAAEIKMMFMVLGWAILSTIPQQPPGEALQQVCCVPPGTREDSEGGSGICLPPSSSSPSRLLCPELLTQKGKGQEA